MVFRRGTFRLHDEERGGSVVETALIVPIFVVLVYWSALFYDIVQLRLKVQEAARFAAWEMTAYELSDYRTQDHQGAFAQAAGSISGRAETLYRSLHSEDEADAHPRLMVTYEYQGVNFTNAEVELTAAAARSLAGVIDGDMGEMALQVMDQVDDAFRWVLNQYGFNSRGLVTAEVNATVWPRLMPRTLLQREDGGFYRHRIIEATEYNLSARASVVADAWTLHFGESTRPTGRTDGDYGDNPFYLQVNRSHMLGLHQIGPLGRIVDVLHDIQAWVEDLVPLPLFTRAHVASMNYQFGDARDREQFRLDTGPRSQKTFHTNPSREVCQGIICAYNMSEYSRTLQMRGNYYMGCPQAQSAPGECNWNTPQ
jgi:Flp pilus assembly protein TadG